MNELSNFGLFCKLLLFLCNEIDNLKSLFGKDNDGKAGVDSMLLAIKKLLSVLIISSAVGVFMPGSVSAPGSVSESKYPSEFFISIESVLQDIRENKNIILVDVRNKEEFNQYRIPGSINIPLYAIKTKSFLKSSRLILINEGHSYKELVKECELLRNSSFTVSILNGGLRQWRQEVSHLEGNVFAQKELNKISHQTFIVNKDHENWIVVNTTPSDKPLQHYQLPQMIQIPYSGDDNQFIKKLKTEIARQKEKQFYSIIICNEDAMTNEKIEKIIQKEKIKNVFYLKDGLNEYKTFIEYIAKAKQGKNKLKTKRSSKAFNNCAGCQ